MPFCWFWHEADHLFFWIWLSKKHQLLKDLWIKIENIPDYSTQNIFWGIVNLFKLTCVYLIYRIITYHITWTSPCWWSIDSHQLSVLFSIHFSYKIHMKKLNNEQVWHIVFTIVSQNIEKNAISLSTPTPGFPRFSMFLSAYLGLRLHGDVPVMRHF